MQTRAVANRLARPVYLVLGLLMLGLGYVGLILPVMPGTIFFILALHCFRRSNAQLEGWLLSRPVIGPVLQDWDRHGAIKRPTKWLIIVVLWLSMIGSVYRAIQVLPPFEAAGCIGFVLACGLGVSWYVWSRPDRVQDPGPS
ncbi:MAG: YbaN family protein [Fimbriimonadaceae bacterium]|nr:YbaN family protein [Fimbriimonadaceae bacterium]